MSNNRPEQLIGRYLPLVRSIARKSFPASARDPDLIQCGMIGLWNAAERWDGVRPFAPFARACIKNKMASYLRKVKRWGATAEQGKPPEADAGTEERQLDAIVLTQRIKAAWPPSSRERIVLLALSKGVSKQAVAAALGLDTYQVTKLAQRAYAALKGP